MQTDRNFTFKADEISPDYYSHNNVDYSRHKRQIIKMIAALIEWLKNIKEDRISVLGI